MKVGIALASEEHAPQRLVEAAVHAEEVGIPDLWISDHYHPWIDRQGHSPFVWSVIGAIAGATRTVRIGTAVTCPTIRIHPAILAQAAATCSLLLEGRFWFGVGSGEALNEHVLGDQWPPAPVRIEMLEEATEVLRLLWEPGRHSHRGTYYTVENARVYDLPEEPPPIYVSAFGPKAMRLAGRVADGYVGTSPDAELLRMYADAGGRGPRVGELKCSFADDPEEAADTAHALWPNLGLPGQLSQDLPTPQHFEQASELVSRDRVAGAIPCGADAGEYLDAIRAYADAGYDEVYLSNIGPNLKEFIDFAARELVPALP